MNKKLFEENLQSKLIIFIQNLQNKNSSILLIKICAKLNIFINEFYFHIEAKNIHNYKLKLDLL